MDTNIDLIGEDLFNKIRSRFKNLTLGNIDGIVTNEPREARFFDFEYAENNQVLGNISITLDEQNLAVMYQRNFLEDQEQTIKDNWFSFLKELRSFAKKRLLNFDVRDITKTNLNKRDYKYLAKNIGDNSMTESKLYGTSKTSFQDIGDARLSIKHSQPVNADLPAGRTQHIQSIYIENNDGERFKYPLKHLSGARAMARHVSEGGQVHDDFGKHILELSQELGKLRKFKNYVNRSSVMAEGLSEYSDIVSDRIATVKKTIENIQKPTQYKDIVENFTISELETVPEELAQNWIDQLTIKQFNEELQDVFPYIYKLISEKTQAAELGPDDLLDTSDIKENEIEYQNLDTTENAEFAEFEKWADDTIDNAVEKENKIPVTEFVLSMYDRETGQFPKGETAILTAVEKDYGEEFINPAKQFIEAIHQKFKEYNGYDTDSDGVLSETPMRFKAVQSANGEWKVFDTKTKQVVHKAYNQHEAEGTAETLNRQATENVEEDLIDPKSNSDRKYFVVPDMDDYYDIQNDRRFAGDIEVADENSEVMVLPNSRFYKLKMMYGNKVKEVDPQFTQTHEGDVDESGLQYYIGKKKYGKDGMKALAQVGRNGASQEQLGKIKDKFADESIELLKLAGVK